MDCIFLGGAKGKTIQFKKCDAYCKACSFVAINKRMITNEAGSVESR